MKEQNARRTLGTSREVVGFGFFWFLVDSGFSFLFEFFFFGFNELTFDDYLSNVFFGWFCSSSFNVNYLVLT